MQYTSAAVCHLCHEAYRYVRLSTWINVQVASGNDASGFAHSNPACQLLLMTTLLSLHVMHVMQPVLRQLILSLAVQDASYKSASILERSMLLFDSIACRLSVHPASAPAHALLEQPRPFVPCMQLTCEVTFMC